MPEYSTGFLYSVMKHKYAIGMDVGAETVIMAYGYKIGNSVLASRPFPLAVYENEFGEKKYGIDAIKRRFLAPDRFCKFNLDAVDFSIANSPKLTKELKLRGVLSNIFRNFWKIFGKMITAREEKKYRASFLNIVRQNMPSDMLLDEDDIESVISMEPYWNFALVNVVGEAARMAQLFPIRFVPRPLAAIIGGCRDGWIRGQRILLAQLSGCSFSASIMECGQWPDCILVMCKRDESIGIDLLITELHQWLLGFICEDTGLDLSSAEAAGVSELEFMKCMASLTDFSKIAFVDGGSHFLAPGLLPDYDLDLALSRQEILALLAPARERILAFLGGILAEYNENLLHRPLDKFLLILEPDDSMDGIEPQLILELLQGAIPQEKEWIILHRNAFAIGAAMLAGFSAQGS